VRLVTSLFSLSCGAPGVGYGSVPGAGKFPQQYRRIKPASEEPDIAAPERG